MADLSLDIGTGPGDDSHPLGEFSRKRNDCVVNAPDESVHGRRGMHWLTFQFRRRPNQLDRTGLPGFRENLLPLGGLLENKQAHRDVEIASLEIMAGGGDPLA
jgi:hypothetical protein